MRDRQLTCWAIDRRKNFIELFLFVLTNIRKGEEKYEQVITSIEVILQT